MNFLRDYFIFLLLCIEKYGLCQSNNGGMHSSSDIPTPAPKFITKGHLYKAVIGDTIILPCKVKDLGSYILLWRRGTSVLTAANLMVTRDTRFKLVDGYNLQIANVRIQDAGDYVCQIGDSEEARDQVHTVEILVPPSVRPVPQNGQITARKGSSVTLECKASGNPVPNIYFYKKNSHSQYHLSEGSTLTLERVDRNHAGIYQCMADNSVREPAYSDIELTVLSPPEIIAEKTWIHAAEGCDIQLVCTLHGDINSEMMWYLNSFLLDPTDRRSMYSKGDKYILNITSFQQSDFGNYSCVADNSLGRTKKYIEVSGRPGPAEFLSPTYSGHLDRYNLTFKIESIPVLEEIKLLYRKLMMNETYQHPGKWHDQILHPSVQRFDSRTFIMSYIIIALEHNSVYEVMVQAKNVYGWNEVSDIHQFYTRSYEISMEDLEYVMSSISLATRTASYGDKFLIILNVLVVVCLMMKR